MTCCVCDMTLPWGVCCHVSRDSSAQWWWFHRCSKKSEGWKRYEVFWSFSKKGTKWNDLLYYGWKTAKTGQIHLFRRCPQCRDPHEKSSKTMVHVIPYHNDDDFIDVQKSLRVEKGTKCFGHFQRKVRSEMTGYSIGEKQPKNMVISPVQRAVFACRTMNFDDRKDGPFNQCLHYFWIMTKSGKIKTSA